jgi:hypothetical protein
VADVPARDVDDEAQIRVDHLLLRPLVAALDALRQLDLLGRREQGIPPSSFMKSEREFESSPSWGL